MIRRISQTIATMAALLLMGPVLYAAEEGGSAADQPMGMTFKWLHFVIVGIAAVWVFGKLLPPVFRRRSDLISEAITKATAAKEEADRRLREAAVKLTSLQQDVATFRAQAQKEAAAEMERLQAATKAELQKIGIAAKGEIEAAERAARADLKALAAKLAVDRAETVVAEQMTPAIHESLISNFVRELKGRPN